MACNHLTHNWDCNCDQDGKIQEIRIQDDLVTGYNGLLGGIPSEPVLLDLFNEKIEKYGLDGACERYPYVDMHLNRRGIYVPENKDMFTKFSNLYHILKAKRRDEAAEAQGNNNQIRQAYQNAQLQQQMPKQNQYVEQTQAPHITPAVQPQQEVHMPARLQFVDRQEQTKDRKQWVRQTKANTVQQTRPQVQVQQPVIDISYEAYQRWLARQQPVVPQSGGCYVSAYDDPRTSNQYTRMTGYVPANQTDYNNYVSVNCHQDNTSTKSGYSREESQFEEAVKNMKVLGGYVPESTKEEATISFKGSSFIDRKEEKEERVHGFNPRNIKSFEPEGGLSGYNPDWHPNDPRNYPQETPQYPMAMMPFGSPMSHPMMGTPGMVNENIPGKESFFSLSKLVQDKGLQQKPAWKPNHLVLKTPEFPDGVDESHPEFERVRRQMVQPFECFEPEQCVANSYTSNVRVTGLENYVSSEDLLSGQMSDKEVTDALIEEQFGDRKNKFRMSPEKQQAMFQGNFQIPVPNQPPQLSALNPYPVNNPYLQAQKIREQSFPMNVPNGYPNSTYYPNMSYGRYQDDNEWMLPSEEELASGKEPIATVVFTDKLREETIAPNRRENFDEDIKVAVVRKHKDENGVEWEEYLYGDEEAVKPKADKKSLTYREAYDMARRVESENDTYALAKELSRYNTTLADDLLWYQKNASLEEFTQVKKEAQSALLKYRGEDKLSCIKSTVFIAGDRTIVKPGKPTNMAELERIAMEEMLNHKPKVEIEREQGEAVINKYRSLTDPVNIQRKAILSGKSVADIVSRLQAFTDMRIICGPAEEKIYKATEKRVKQLPQIKILERDNYLTWKKLMKLSKKSSGHDMSNFDREFDEWWMKPRVVTPAQKAKQLEDYRMKKTEENIHRLTMAALLSPTVEQKVDAYKDAILKAWREYDKGVMTLDLNFTQFTEKMNFLLSRNIELNIERESNKTTRLFDPVDYLNEVRKHSAIRNYQDGKGYVPTMDLMDQKIYSEKRQAFINQIFKKANRGTIT